MRRYYNKGSLVGGQVKLDKMGNNDGKISGEDFAVIRSQKMGGGMMKRPMYKEGTPKKKGKDIMSTFIADDARSGAGKSGGADSGKTGEMRSKLGKQEVQMKKDIKNKIKKTIETTKKIAKKTKELLKAPIIAFHKKAEDNYKKYPDRRVRIYKDPRDKVKKANGGMMEEAKEINSKIKNSRTLKMGGGMMKRMGLKKGTVIEQGPPGTEGQYNKAAKDRLSTIVKNKKTLKSTNPKISQAKKDKARKQNKFLQGGDGQNFKKPIKQYASGGRVKRAAGGPGLYANIKAKKDRIAGGSGETMRKVGTKGAPTAQNFINAAKTAKKV